MGEYGGAVREQNGRNGPQRVSRAARYIYIKYTPDLGFEIALLGREREQGRFRGSIKGARGRSEGVGGRSKGSKDKYTQRTSDQDV